MLDLVQNRVNYFRLIWAAIVHDTPCIPIQSYRSITWNSLTTSRVLCTFHVKNHIALEEPRWSYTPLWIVIGHLFVQITKGTRSKSEHLCPKDMMVGMQYRIQTSCIAQGDSLMKLHLFLGGRDNKVTPRKPSHEVILLEVPIGFVVTKRYDWIKI